MKDKKRVFCYYCKKDVTDELITADLGFLMEYSLVQKGYTCKSCSNKLKKKEVKTK